MFRKLLIALGLIALTAANCASSAEITNFAYGDEHLSKIEDVKSEYGDEPIISIRSIVNNHSTDIKSWRRAIAATAFLGSDGIKLLCEELQPMLSAKQFGDKTQFCLRTVAYVHDTRSMEISLTVLESSEVPTKLKQEAAENILAQIAQTQLNGSVLSFNTAYPAYSTGTRIDAACLSRSKERIGIIISALPEGEGFRHLRDELDNAMSAIDKKLAGAKDDSAISEQAKKLP